MFPGKSRAFTLVEILIVVIILGILAAIIMPSLAKAGEEAAISATYTDLQKLRRAVGVYRVRYGELPPITEGDATGIDDGSGPWGPLVDVMDDEGKPGQFFKQAPVNSYMGGPNARRVGFASGPDIQWQEEVGWLYNPDNGEVYAGCFDANDKPIPRP